MTVHDWTRGTTCSVRARLISTGFPDPLWKIKSSFKAAFHFYSDCLRLIEKDVQCVTDQPLIALVRSGGDWWSARGGQRCDCRLNTSLGALVEREVTGIHNNHEGCRLFYSALRSSSAVTMATNQPDSLFLLTPFILSALITSHNLFLSVQPTQPSCSRGPFCPLHFAVSDSLPESTKCLIWDFSI